MKKTIFIIALFLFLLPSRTYAAPFQGVGFETGDSGEADATSGTFSVQSTTKRTGTYALRTNPTTTATGFYDVRCVAVSGAGANCNVASVFARFGFRPATLPASGDEDIADCIDTGDAKKITIRINSTGNLVAYNNLGVAVSTGSTVLATGTFYVVEFSSTTGVTSSYEVKINGVSEFTGTSTFSTANNRGCRFGKVTNTGGNSVDFYYDDILLENAAFPGVGEVKVMLPDSNGNYQTWTIGAGGGSHYENVDEIPHDSDTTYLLSTGTATNAETEGLVSGATAGISGTVNFVKGFYVAKRNGGTNGSLLLRLRSNTTDSDTTGVAANNQYVQRHKIFATDPATAAAWVLSALDSVEVGVVENQTGVNTSRATLVGIMVDYIPSGATPTPTPVVDRAYIYEDY